MQEKGRDIAIAPDPIFVTFLKKEWYQDALLDIKKIQDLGFLTYQKLLQETKVSKHAHNHKNRYILPYPDTPFCLISYIYIKESYVFLCIDVTCIEELHTDA